MENTNLTLQLKDAVKVFAGLSEKDLGALMTLAFCNDVDLNICIEYLKNVQLSRMVERFEPSINYRRIINTYSATAEKSASAAYVETLITDVKEYSDWLNNH